jgi:hypothetical protein
MIKSKQINKLKPLMMRYDYNCHTSLFGKRLTIKRAIKRFSQTLRQNGGRIVNKNRSEIYSQTFLQIFEKNQKEEGKFFKFIFSIKTSQNLICFPIPLPFLLNSKMIIFLRRKQKKEKKSFPLPFMAIKVNLLFAISLWIQDTFRPFLSTPGLLDGLKLGFGSVGEIKLMLLTMFWRT